MIRRADKSTIANFASILSYETWDDVFSETEVNVTYDKFLNILCKLSHEKSKNSSKHKTMDN